MSSSLLAVKALQKHFVDTSGFLRWKRVHRVKAVDGVSFSILPNEVIGMVGESGCGKSTIGNLVLGIHPPTGGDIYFEGELVSKMNERKLRDFRKSVQMVFQDPFASLDPMMTLYDIISEPYDIFGLYDKKERVERTDDLLRRVGLEADYSSRYPHELSGGQRQRVAIARALALHPKLIIADEVTSSLDVSVKAQIINLLEDLKQQEGLSIFFISHDLSVVTHISNRVLVMYLGKIVESGKTNELFRDPLHPYTKLLIEAVPVPDPRRRKKRQLIRGEVSENLWAEQGCIFYPRCNKRSDACLSGHPPLRGITPGRYVACYNAENIGNEE